MNSPLFIGHEIYRGSSYGRWHPLRVPRVSTVMDLSRALGWLPKDQFVTSPRAKPEALVNWHTADYIGALQRVEADQIATAQDLALHDIGSVTNPVFPEIFRRPATAAGGSILAGELLREGGVVYNPAGGTHHGMPNRANGFCYLNDPVLAMLSLRRFGVRRIAFVDIDAHHPDGVEVGFGGDPDCLMISVHEARLWPRSGPVENDGGGNALNVAVPRGFNDSEMAFVRDALILPRVQAFMPDAIVLLCGADAVEEDPLSHLQLSNNAHWDILRRLMNMAPRLLVLGGGGYNPWSVGRLWTGVWGILNGHDLPATMPEKAEAVLRALRFDGNRRGKNPPEHWFTTLQDDPRQGDVRNEVKEAVRQLLKRPVL
ncbi:acetoin utilization protein AcuC [Sulfitobacter mediterraneus]|uniref:acetoin utilization protein AcuC n=1 Tax=Sulfitobacter mediterraneus TaxID=83219 RepID=UPI001933E1C0|nr:acetoin utilization protein AcuC [Sulfitobacter mediterraneus]MBM1308696.1 acetoin utilization protein AcuC [Sulfitobacter mediterraneus]MBM1312581.1 acetoin utilization protein AcuC [Sulfitobacter mediterraneus]MBM1320962.1 acetoin utilization protein AcuC [Sulfitobacter mediterraneus]MBM1324850.1 acetoin utilization protein AcuC [Sulfitobacter mediterraneus]MBM1396196.1 acetoin utilization protein AcuC [Sulfitobacter mediterraneus]